MAKFPDSALLRAKIAFSYVLDILNERTDDPWRYTELAWKLATEAEANPHKSRLETFLCRWVMPILYQLHEGNFERSVVEAEAAAKLVPYDPLAHADLALYLANAGKTDRAIEWAEESIRRDASPLDFYFGNLGFAYYLADRPADAVVQLQKMERQWQVNLAAAYARLGKLDEARASITKLLKDKPGWTIKSEAVWPTTRQPQLIEPLLKLYLADLAKAGLPEK
ncbi:MAG: hypothetical protein AAAC48_05995 [Phyllobacterium sp.]|uniref:hypothetical protein n=1 Tax=Phyllobacterium sp. TaxID=1871046 RepID=UPI0030EFD6EF